MKCFVAVAFLPMMCLLCGCEGEDQKLPHIVIFDTVRGSPVTHTWMDITRYEWDVAGNLRVAGTLGSVVVGDDEITITENTREVYTAGTVTKLVEY